MSSKLCLRSAHELALPYSKHNLICLHLISQSAANYSMKKEAAYPINIDAPGNKEASDIDCT